MENTNGTQTEKVTIKKANEKSWKGKPFWEIETEDGRVGSSNDKDIATYIGQEVALIVKNSGKEYKGVPQYYFNLPGASSGTGKKSFAPKDYTADKRMNALTNAVNSVKQIEGKVISESILKLADKYFEWLNTK